MIGTLRVDTIWFLGLETYREFAPSPLANSFRDPPRALLLPVQGSPEALRSHAQGPRISFVYLWCHSESLVSSPRRRRGLGLTLTLRPLSSLLVGRRETFKEPSSDFYMVLVWFLVWIIRTVANKPMVSITSWVAGNPYMHKTSWVLKSFPSTRMFDSWGSSAAEEWGMVWFSQLLCR